MDEESLEHEGKKMVKTDTRGAEENGPAAENYEEENRRVGKGQCGERW